MRDCPHCGTTIPAQSRFCPECGQSLAAQAGPGPRRRWPPDPLLLAVALLLAGAVVLFVGREWAWGVAAVLLAGLVLLFRREAERRAARYALSGVRARVAATREAMAVRSRGQLELFRARRERAELEAERVAGLRELGQRVFDEDEAGTEEARAAVADVIVRIRGKEAEIDTLIKKTEERIQRAQAGFQPTRKLESPPEPARVPEPWPPPDEGDPPQPATVPEPSPGDPAPEPRHPPTPEDEGDAKA